jgi:phage anti-repressor protein
MIAESQDEYPADLDDVWVWIGYSRKSDAKAKLVADFVEGVDYILRNIPQNSDTSNRGRGRPPKDIYLTVDCFKHFCVMAGTPEGKQVRLHYFEIEKKFKAAQAALATSSSYLNSPRKKPKKQSPHKA